MSETRYLTADKAEEIRSYLRAFSEDTGLSGHDLARLLDVHPSTVGHILDGKDRPSPELADRLLRMIREYREAHQGERIEQDASGRALAATPATPKASAPAGFQPTRCARTVMGTLDFAARKRLSGGIFGDPGVGKSAAVRQWSATTKHAHLVVTCRAYTSYTKLLQAIARGLGLGDGGISLGDLDEAAHEELSARPRLLVIDEADMLNSRTLDWLRTFQDECGRTNVVYLGKPAFYRRLQISHVRSSQDLRQVWSRLAFRRFLGGIDRAEVVAAVAAHGLADAFEPQALDALFDAIHGSYRDLDMTVALIEQILEENARLGGKVTPAVVNKATESRFGADMGKRGAR